MKASICAPPMAPIHTGTPKASAGLTARDRAVEVRRRGGGDLRRLAAGLDGDALQVRLPGIDPRSEIEHEGGLAADPLPRFSARDRAAQQDLPGGACAMLPRAEPAYGSFDDAGVPAFRAV
jgi:hypothetical protein